MSLVRNSGVVRVGLVITVAIAASAGATACGEEDNGRPPAAGEAILHVHGLGINPADGSLQIATHSGLFRSPKGSTKAVRVGTGAQDTMGFTVVGPNRFLGSGHPGPGEDGPPNLGLIESTDAGQSWQSVSLAGEADFHVLRYAQDRVYAVNALTGEITLSDDRGESWQRRRPPASVIDLVVDAGNPERIIASTGAGLGLSENDGRQWRRLPGEIGLLAWPDAEHLFLINAEGEVHISEDGGKGWSAVGNIGGQPAAFTAENAQHLYAALGDGTVVESTNGGTSWTNRLSP